jgi:hypothetical protein
MTKTPFSRRLQHLREERSLSQGELAARLQRAGVPKVSQGEISNWERRAGWRLYPAAFVALRRVLHLTDEEARELVLLWAYDTTL